MKKNEAIEELCEALGLSSEANFQLPDPGLVAFYKDYKNRVIWLNKEIDESLYDEVRMIIQWNREDDEANIPIKSRKPIKIFINSYGGDLMAAFTMIDMMNASKTPVYTINMGVAMSAGGLILLNGHKGHRYCCKLSQALIHNGSGGASGEFSAVVSATENYKKTIGFMHQNILEHTKIDEKTLKKWKGKEMYLYADDQISYGLVDKIITSLNEVSND